MLGRLPKALVGGELELDVEGSARAYDTLGTQYAMRPEEVAAGVMEIATANMVNGIRQGDHHPRQGSEPLRVGELRAAPAGSSATDVAEFLDVKTVISPPNPGNLSAYGLHVCDVKQDYIRTIVRQQSTSDKAEIEAAWADLEATGRSELASEGVAADRIQLMRSADMRYVGEGHEVNVLIPDGYAGAAALDHAWQAFHDVHFETFGFDYRGEQDVELVNLRVQAVGEASPARHPGIPGRRERSASQFAARDFLPRPGLGGLPDLRPDLARPRPEGSRADGDRGIRLHRGGSSGVGRASGRLSAT